MGSKYTSPLKGQMGYCFSCGMPTKEVVEKCQFCLENEQSAPKFDAFTGCCKAELENTKGTLDRLLKCGIIGEQETVAELIGVLIQEIE